MSLPRHAALRIDGALVALCPADDAAAVDALRAQARRLADAQLGVVTLRRERTDTPCSSWAATHLVCATSALWPGERRLVVHLDRGVALEHGASTPTVYCDRSGWIWRDRAKRLASVRVVRVVDLATCAEVAVDRYPRRASVRTRVTLAAAPAA